MSDKKIVIPSNIKEIIIPKNTEVGDIQKHGLEPSALPVSSLKPIDTSGSNDSKNEKKSS